jgi:homoaconitase/3-isopropylmalate dehydratase large subunit
MITYGTNPGMVAAVSGSVPIREGDPCLQRRSPGPATRERLADKPVQVVFIGSCAMPASDLAAAAEVMRPEGCGVRAGRQARQIKRKLKSKVMRSLY